MVIIIIIIMIKIIIIIQGDPISLPESAELSPLRVAHIFYTVLSTRERGSSERGHGVCRHPEQSSKNYRPYRELSADRSRKWGHPVGY